MRDQVGDRLDLAFEDLGEQSVKNIARPIRVFRDRCSTATPAPRRAAAQAATAGSAAAKPSIAVLPFANMSGDPEQEFFADGLTEDIITELSRFRDLLVISRNSAFVHKGKAGAGARTSRASSASTTWSRAACARPATGSASPSS